MMKKLLLFLAFSVITVTSWAQTSLDTAVNFTVKDPYGNSLTLFDILDQGKLVVIDFFSTA